MTGLCTDDIEHVFSSSANRGRGLPRTLSSGLEQRNRNLLCTLIALLCSIIIHSLKATKSLNDSSTSTAFFLPSSCPVPCAHQHRATALARASKILPCLWAWYESVTARRPRPLSTPLVLPSCLPAGLPRAAALPELLKRKEKGHGAVGTASPAADPFPGACSPSFSPTPAPQHG